MADDVVVHEYGDPGAPPMVLLHGLTEAGTTWPDAVEHWGAHWRMLAVDLRGHGDSPRFTDEELADTAAVVLADVLRVLDEVRRPVALVGHSYGALFALRAALARPDLVRGLVLEDPARPIDLRPPPPEFFEHQERFLDAMLDSRAGDPPDPGGDDVERGRDPGLGGVQATGRPPADPPPGTRAGPLARPHRQRGRPDPARRAARRGRRRADGQRRGDDRPDPRRRSLHPPRRPRGVLRGRRPVPREPASLERPATPIRLRGRGAELAAIRRRIGVVVPTAGRPPGLRSTR